ncbi:hypothetical protein L917_12536 [Phytophthora nicotianae]|uniref:Uncharacterized protein n=1 Tax=Phytophthora nicotianae TaxID=4792 RepID=W2KVH7_PHYNI|nr:hypothetical protein L917_12536 [Phytophthora nicotianae]
MARTLVTHGNGHAQHSTHNTGGHLSPWPGHSSHLAADTHNTVHTTLADTCHLGPDTHYLHVNLFLLIRRFGAGIDLFIMHNGIF